ncbi:Multiple inositol polyphosphate phosphatase 1 [Oopsacas minuta]|uniref:Multiple inositol polyphosphate phosphatase 1 n=1 Tax=Oopsacas minuta TaxID=111878 RepID=A0AAV7JRH4_9METZ|nr:Multiple inositol polyphosphate phosphatase 1 [Oopsacas minuta]
MRNFVENHLSSKLLQSIFICFFAGICWYLFFVNENNLLHFPPYRFSLKARYRFSPLQKLLPSSQCEISHLLAVCRHTSRYPTSTNIEQFSVLQNKLHNISFISPYEWLQNWTNNFSLDRAGELSTAGEIEAILIGERYKRRYMELFDYYSPDLYQVNSTYKNRAYGTAIAFMTGLFGKNFKDKFEVTRNTEDDNLLRFFDNCIKYEQNIIQNASKIVDKIREGPEFVELLQRVNNRLGTQLLTWIDIDTLWRICTMEFLATRSSLVCSVFSDQDSQLFEYFYDSRAYLLKSGGYEINVKMSCILLKHIVSKLQLAANGDRKKAQLYFTHAETLIPLLALLNITTHNLVMENKHLYDRANMYGLLVPMGANLAFNLFRCVNGEMILTIELNEELVLFGKHLKSSVLLSEFFEIANFLISDCDPTTFCSIPGSD